MTLIPYLEIPTNPNTAPGTPLGSLIDAAAQLAIAVNNISPQWSQPLPYLIRPAIKGLEQLTGIPFSFPDPVPPFTGGQCECELYRVNITTNAGPNTDTFNVDVNGPISGLYWASGLVPGNWDYRFQHLTAQCTPTFFNVFANISSEDRQDGTVTATINSVTPLGTFTDVCGDPIPTYPEIIPVAANLNSTASIPLPQGGFFPTPLVYIQPQINFDVNLNLNFDVPITIVAPDLGIQIGFNVGGVNLNFGVPGSKQPPSENPDPRSPKPLPPYPYPDYNDILQKIKDDVKAQGDLLKELFDCVCDERKQVITTAIPNNNSGCFTCPEYTRAVSLQLTQIASNNRNQAGISAPDVEYAGWAWFQYRNVGLGERLPVDGQNKIFIPTGEPTSFCYTLYAGNEAQGIIYSVLPLVES